MRRESVALGLLSIAALAVLAFPGGASVADPGTVVPTRADAVVKTEAEWKAELTEEEFKILRRAGTERAFTGKYWNQKKDGVYRCAACGLELFDSRTKFKSGTGWPSFYSPAAKDRVAEQKDRALGMVRTEILCNRCGGHLGHVFPDGPEPTGLRYCVNGNALDFEERAKK